ncbi:hypothetical protein AB1Y20_009852 [Prymnesium parvum]|uniref:aspartate--tRNA ligase n=1 Tax=Prymnesium parvum TaxID=97485 RepID=A0AB34K1K9_PRYPA
MESSPEALAEKRKADKLRKQEEKAKKEQEKAARQAQREAAQTAKLSQVISAPELTTCDLHDHKWGNLFIQSNARTSRAWCRACDLVPQLKGEKLWIRGRLATSRKQGKTLCFVQLRQSMYTVQAVVSAKEGELVAFAAAIPRESVIDVYGEVSVPETPIASCTQQLVELQVEQLFCISRSTPELPLQLEDAARTDEELLADPELTRVNQDVRLNNRVIDLRTPANQAIFRLQSAVCELFRGFLSSQGFTEIHSPKLVGTASEGGADVFRVEYFGGAAYLAQSPQLYKQMALMADLDRVFEVGPVFRAENSYTHRHMTEFTGLDMEMTFLEHYSEVLDMLDRTFNAVFDGLNQRFRTELDIVRTQHPFEDLRYKCPCLRFTYSEAMALLRTHGPTKLAEELAAATDLALRAKLQERIDSVRVHADDEDIGTEDEKLLGSIVADKYEQDFYIIDKFPASVRPFYTMPDPLNPTFSNSYDIFIRGEEVTSGAQRIHDPDMLLKQAAAKDPPVDLTPIQAYVDSFKYGAFPHAGGGVGLERVVMLFLGLPNIRKTSLFPRDPKRLSP